MVSNRDLPVIDPQPGEAPGCGPNAYVSNEELALLATMRRIRSDALALRRQLAATAEDAARTALEAQLDALRLEWEALARRREAAYRRKMIMLGHAEPDIEWPAP